MRLMRHRNYRYEHFDHDLALRPDFWLLSVMLYLSRGFVLPFIAAAFGRGADGHMAYILEGTKHPLPFIVSSLPALLIIISWSKRVPDAGRVTRFIWAWGRWFLIGSAVLDASFIMVLDRSFHQDLEIILMILDMVVLSFLFLSKRVKDVFSDFPVPETEPLHTHRRGRDSRENYNYLTEAFKIAERMALDDVSGEIAQCLRAVKSPEHITAGNWSGLGVRAAEAGHLEDASVLFQAAAQIEPQNHIHPRNLCEVFRRLGLHHAAVTSGLTAMRMAPSDPVSHFNLALVQTEYGQYELALLNYREAVNLSPAYSEAWNNMGLLLKSMGREDEAGYALQQSLKVRDTQSP